MEYTELTGDEVCSAKQATLFRLIYRSHYLVPIAQQDGELGVILQVARPANAAQGITAALLICDNLIAQTLEGLKTAVLTLYEKISQDKRHDSVELREQGVASARVFSHWAMARVAEHGDRDIPLMACYC